MSATIHELHPVSPVGHFLRVGHTGYRKLEDLHASGRLVINRVLVDAAHIGKQKELLDSLRESGSEIILDPQTAELSTPGGHLTSARKLPWADPNGPYDPENFGRDRISNMAARIADFAVEHKIDVVHSPTRLLYESPRDSWFPIDVETCRALRRALDARGGKAIAIDYPLLTTYRVLLDSGARKAIASQLSDLPFDYLWTRIANFGSDKSAAGLQKYINALRDFHELGKAIVADGVGGLLGLAIIAFGASGGICHGVAEKERFYPRDWWKPRGSGSGGGTKTRVYLAGIDAYLDEEQARTLLATRNAKPLLGCRDTGCCAGGWEDMILKPKTHYLTQTMRRIEALAVVPELRRPDHFLSHQLAPADRVARAALRLKVPDTKILHKLSKNSRRIDDMRRVLEELHVTGHNLSRSLGPAKRAGQSGVLATTRRG